MLKYYNYDIVFQEVPDEVSLAINITGCPNHCEGCHSPHLWEDTGTPLNTAELERLIGLYRSSITCVLLMGGDNDSSEIEKIAQHIRNTTNLKVAWYSGRTQMPTNTKDFDYIKLGPYISSRGSLRSNTTNQKLLKRINSSWEDITHTFWKQN